MATCTPITRDNVSLIRCNLFQIVRTWRHLACTKNFVVFIYVLEVVGCIEYPYYEHGHMELRI